ncbi:MAG TPA: ABC transporter ATP-binding protein [Dehalococcoidia bacterium]
MLRAVAQPAPATVPAAGQPVVDVRNVGKVYQNGTLALSDVTLQLHAGEFVTLLGPSGCGKSTVLRIVAGLGKPSSGSVAVDGQEPEAARRRGHEMAFVFQDPTLLPWLTVRKNTELPLKLRGVGRKERERLASSAIRLVGLTGFEQAYPRELSGGMKMRVSIARALAQEPKVLLMDEPFGALDEITRQRLNEDLLDMWQAAQWTVLFVTHNVFEAAYLSTRIVVMSSRPGRIVADIPVDAPYPRPPEFRSSPGFGALVSAVVQFLRDA